MTSHRREYFFSAHAVGASAHFHRVGNLNNLDHPVPALGGSVLAVTGGRTSANLSNFCYSIDKPKRKTLLCVRSIDTKIEGRIGKDGFETEIEAQVQSIELVEMLRIDHISMHFNSARHRGGEGKQVDVTTKGCKIEGMHLGAVEARIKLDEEPLCAAGTKDSLAAFYKKKPASYREKNRWRFNVHPKSGELLDFDGYHHCSLVREIKLIGKEKDKHGIEVDGYTIYWKGFGRIFLAEVATSGNDRRLTMARLEMGSDAGGGGVVVCGRSNGQVGTS
jgi:hypothetical protein